MRPDQSGYTDPDLKRMAYVPVPGYVRNPWQDYPPNYPCICGQGKKFKKCCKGRMKEVIRSIDGPRMLSAMKARILAVQELRRESSAEGKLYAEAKLHATNAAGTKKIIN